MCNLRYFFTILKVFIRPVTNYVYIKKSWYIFRCVCPEVIYYRVLSIFGYTSVKIGDLSLSQSNFKIHELE